MNFKFLTENKPNRKKRREYCTKFIKDLFFHNEIETTIFPRTYPSLTFTIEVQSIKLHSCSALAFPIIEARMIYTDTEEMHFINIEVDMNALN